MKKLSIISKLTAAATLGAVVLVPTVGAQSQANTSQNQVGLEISAPLYEFSINPGENAQDIVKIKNIGASRGTFYPSVVDFTADDEKPGQPVFLDPDENNNTYSLAKWVNFTKEAVTLEPKQSAAFNFNISVPANAEPGGHYGAILFTSEPGKLESGTGLSLEAVVGSLVLVRVAGDANEAASIKEFTTDKKMYDKTNVNFSLTVNNAGNVHVKPKGTITVKNIFGGSVAVRDVNQEGANVLPESNRKFAIAWEDPGFKLGYYTATAVLTYGNPAQTLTAQTSFWIIPWKTLAITLLILLIIVVLLAMFVRRYNAWIISKASSNKQ